MVGDGTIKIESTVAPAFEKPRYIGSRVHFVTCGEGVYLVSLGSECFQELDVHTVWNQPATYADDTPFVGGHRAKPATGFKNTLQLANVEFRIGDMFGNPGAVNQIEGIVLER